MKRQELVRGQIYKVTESCGMIGLDGEYLGRMSIGNKHECFVFKRVNQPYVSSVGFSERISDKDRELQERQYKYFGAQWRIVDASKEAPDLYLYNTHYGNSPTSLKSLNDLYSKSNSLDFKYEEKRN